jgi:hypothetical protein
MGRGRLPLEKSKSFGFAALFAVFHPGPTDPVTCSARPCLRSRFQQTQKQVQTTKGRYALRLYRAGWRSQSEIEFVLDALRHCGQRGTRVSVPVPKRDGRFIRADFSSRHQRFAGNLQGRSEPLRTPVCTSPLTAPRRERLLVRPFFDLFLKTRA